MKNIENKINYKVISTSKNDVGIITRFKVSINGAEFTINRVYNKFKPTKMFEFMDKISYDKEGNPVEIDWTTCVSGLYHLANEMGLRLVLGASHYAVGGKISYFIDDHFLTDEDLLIEQAENSYVPYNGDDL